MEVRRDSEIIETSLVTTQSDVSANESPATDQPVKVDVPVVPEKVDREVTSPGLYDIARYQAS